MLWPYYGKEAAEHSEEIKACLWNEPFKALIDFGLSLSLTLTVMKTRPAAAAKSRPTNRLSCWDDGEGYHPQPGGS